MAILDLRQRSGYLFLAVVLGQVLIVSAQVNSRNGVPVLETVTFGAFAQVQRAASSVLGGVRRVWTGYAGLRAVQAQNESLQRQLASVQVELQVQRALADRTRGLERLLEMRDHSNLSTAAAEIIAGGADPEFRTVTIDKGSRDGLHADMAVIAPAGIVGRVVVATGRAAKVQLLLDRNAAAGALIERSRAQGVVVGHGEDRLDLAYVSEASDVTTGDVVVTSGIDGIYPKGFVIGRVEAVEKNGPAYTRIVVAPAVDFRSLEEVLVVLSPAAADEAASEKAQ